MAVRIFTPEGIDALNTTTGEVTPEIRLWANTRYEMSRQALEKASDQKVRTMMDTDDLSDMAWDIIARAAQVSDTLKADLGVRSSRYGNEDAWLRGVGKFLQKIVEEPGDYVDYWNLEEEEGVNAAMMREIALELSHRAKKTLVTSPTQRGKQG
jgi:hypothetical protein